MSEYYDRDNIKNDWNVISSLMKLFYIIILSMNKYANILQDHMKEENTKCNIIIVTFKNIIQPKQFCIYY